MIEKERFEIKACRHPPAKFEDHLTPYGLNLVGYAEGIKIRKCVELFAKYFRREFSYDFIQYSVFPEKKNEDMLTKPYLFGEIEYGFNYVSYGACCFRYRGQEYWNNIRPHWALQWIWIHPYKRNQGLLTKYWAYFEERFGNFMIEEPRSKSMENFILARKGKFNHLYTDLLITDSAVSEPRA